MSSLITRQPPGPKPQPLEERFWRFVNKTETCWLWTGGQMTAGYGMMGVAIAPGVHKYTGAHRISYELFKGPIPPDKEIDHLCRVRLCVNPEHLEAVTRSVNQLRGNAGQWLANQMLAKTDCPQGHAYDLFNTYISTNGSRHCRACGRDNTRRYRERCHVRG